MLFSAGLCLVVATNVMSVHSQNSKCEGSKISVAKHSALACAISDAPRVLHFSAFIIYIIIHKLLLLENFLIIA